VRCSIDSGGVLRRLGTQAANHVLQDSFPLIHRCLGIVQGEIFLFDDVHP